MAENSGRRAGGTPFKPGKSGNPGGRPKSKLNQLLAKHLGLKANDSGEKWEMLLVKRVIALAVTGDKWALEFIWDRLEGKPAHHLTDGDGNDIPVRFTLNLGDGAGK